MKSSSTQLKLTALIAALAGFLVLQGCSSAPKKAEISAPGAKDLNDVDIMHRVKPHERLGDISIHYTGTSRNWQRIADYNGISDPRLLRMGTVIAIPNSLLIEPQLQKQAVEATNKELQLVAASRSSVATTPNNTLAIKRRAPEKSSDVVLEPVKTNRAFKLSPITEAKSAGLTQSKSSAMKVQVVGTYFPKGIYQQPANHSPMILRAAPGTLFEFEYLVNSWYKIVTKNGIGYLREDDGKVVAPTSQP